MWYLCCRHARAGHIFRNAADDELDAEAALGRRDRRKSPAARHRQARSFNMDTAHQAGIAGMGLYALEAVLRHGRVQGRREGSNEKRKPDFRKYAKTRPARDESLTSTTTRALADQVRRFATERVAPGFQERDRTRVLDRTPMREMGALGFIAPELPNAYGGLGTGCLAASVIHEAIARADLSMSYINLLGR